MSWPKKDTRRIHINDREYRWHLSGNHLDSKVRITIGTQRGKFFLFVDPYAHDLEITPSTVKRALLWALSRGWSPEKGPTRAVGYSMGKKEFVWLPKDVRFEHEINREKPGGQEDRLKGQS